MKITFVVGLFPAVSETFIIDQICDLIDRGISVNVISFRRGGFSNISKRYYEYNLDSITKYVDMPSNLLARVLGFIPRFLMLLVNIKLLLKNSSSISDLVKLTYWSYGFINNETDLYHCHFGTIATKFLRVRNTLGLKTKFITTFYGYDISNTVKDKGLAVYDELKNESSAFIAMSEDMKRRMIDLGFREDKISVNPPGVPVNDIEYKNRSFNGAFKIVSVGRLVEKKGFDDLIEAISIVRDSGYSNLSLDIIGDGPLRSTFESMIENRGLKDIVNIKGFMPIDDVMKVLYDKDLFIQSSKTAKNGDME